MTTSAPFDLHAAMQSLAQRRPVLRPRRDFNHALAAEIQLHYPHASVSHSNPVGGSWKVLQIRLGHEVIGIKPRYHTAYLHCIVNEEAFQLKNQAAQNLARYDVLRDLMRVERLVLQGAFTRGYVVFLTNDAQFWQPPVRRDTCDADFRLHEGRVLEGTLRWGAHTGAGTMRGREQPIVLKGQYRCSWQSYSVVPYHKNGVFRYLLLEARA